MINKVHANALATSASVVGVKIERDKNNRTCYHDPD